MPNYDKLTKKEALELWKQHCADVQTATTIGRGETNAQRDQRIRRVRADYGAFVDYYFPHYTMNPQTGAQTPCAPFHIKAAKEVKANKNLRAVYKWHRGAAKSTHLDIFIPLWLKCQEQREINLMVLVGKSEDNANTLLADIQAELQYNQRYINDFGEQYNSGSWEDGQFVTKDGTAFFARGRGQSPRGLRYRSFNVERRAWCLRPRAKAHRLGKGGFVRSLGRWPWTIHHGGQSHFKKQCAAKDSRNKRRARLTGQYIGR